MVVKPKKSLVADGEKTVVADAIGT